MKNLLVVVTFLVTSIAFAQTDSLAVVKEAIQEYQQMDSIVKSLNYKTGEVELGDGVAKLVVPQGFKFLGAEESSYVLSDLWGNPPSEVLGMLFPEDMTPMSDNFTFAVEIDYSEEGYIEDEDAEDMDYDELLEDMQSDINDSNEARIEQGYGSMVLVGWAAAPFYDQANKKLHWAKEFKFNDSELNTLNYNIRILGRKGFLTMNAIGDITVLPEVNKDIDKILGSVEFNDGFRYGDFNPDIDDVAAYGIGGLIAGKVLAKAGILALLLKFWKILALAAVGAFSVLKKKIFGKKEEEEVAVVEESEEEKKEE